MMSEPMNGNSSDRFEEAAVSHVSATDFFNLQDRFKHSVCDHYDRDKIHSDVVRHAVDGSIKLFDALALRDILRSVKPRSILEVGTFLGFSLRWMLDSTVDFSPIFTSLDPRVRHRIFDDIKIHVRDFTSEHRDRLTFVDAYLSERNDEMFLYDYLNYEPKLSRVGALEFLRSIQVISQPFSEFDFAFIDGDHSYNATILNVSLVARMMPAGGYIVVHDAISWPHVKPALEALGSIGGLTCVRVLGEDFHHWLGRHHAFSHLAHKISFSALCDGLGLVKVELGADINPAYVSRLLRTK
jgi:cephalosporin hydroxylase